MCEMQCFNNYHSLTIYYHNYKLFWFTINVFSTLKLFDSGKHLVFAN